MDYVKFTIIIVIFFFKNVIKVVNNVQEETKINVQLVKKILSIPIRHDLQNNEIKYIIKSINNFYDKL